MNHELNHLLDLVYELEDISMGISKDCETLIFRIVDQVELLVENNDKLKVLK